MPPTKEQLEGLGVAMMDLDTSRSMDVHAAWARAWNYCMEQAARRCRQAALDIKLNPGASACAEFVEAMKTQGR